MVDIVEHIAYSTYMHTVELPSPGQRVECVLMGNDPDPIPSGARGTVTRVDPCGREHHISVAWDSGRSLNLISTVDKFRVL